MSSLKSIDFFVKSSDDYDASNIAVRFWRTKYKVCFYDVMAMKFEDASEYMDSPFCRYAFESSIFPTLASRRITARSLRPREKAMASFLRFAYPRGLPGFYHRNMVELFNYS